MGAPPRGSGRRPGGGNDHESLRPVQQYTPFSTAAASLSEHMRAFKILTLPASFCKVPCDSPGPFTIEGLHMKIMFQKLA